MPQVVVTRDVSQKLPDVGCSLANDSRIVCEWGRVSQYNIFSWIDFVEVVVGDDKYLCNESRMSISLFVACAYYSNIHPDLSPLCPQGPSSWLILPIVSSILFPPRYTAGLVATFVSASLRFSHKFQKHLLHPTAILLTIFCNLSSFLFYKKWPFRTFNSSTSTIKRLVHQTWSNMPRVHVCPFF